MKRVRDTTQKKIARAANSEGKPCQVWTDGTNLYIYDNGAYVELDGTMAIYGPVWQELPEDDEVGVYDTFKPTDMGTPEDTFTATYVFYDYDETTVLKEGTVKDGGTPVAPTDPTREGYTFTGWLPEVGPISKNTGYVAQYEEDEE